MKTIFSIITLSVLVLTSDVSADGTKGGCNCAGPTATNPAYQQDCENCCIWEWDCPPSNCSTFFGTPPSCSSSSPDKEDMKDKRVERHQEVINKNENTVE